MDVGGWLRGLGLGQYAAAFENNAVDAETLRELTAEDLKEIRVSALHRKKILEAIAALESGENGQRSRQRTSSAAVASSPQPAAAGTAARCRISDPSLPPK